LISDENIYQAIYCIESYIFEKELLCKEDVKILLKLKDKFDIEFISKIIDEVKHVIELRI